MPEIKKTLNKISAQRNKAEQITLNKRKQEIINKKLQQ